MGRSITSYELLDWIEKQARQHDWGITTRKGATTHLIVKLFKPCGTYTACIPMHRGQDLRTGTRSRILKNLGL